MALLKNIKYPNGTETNYHKISEIKIVPFTKTVMVTPASSPEEIPVYETLRLYRVEMVVRSYVSQDIRDDSEYNYLAIKKYDKEAIPEEMESTPIMKLAYDALKLVPDFEGAEDI